MRKHMRACVRENICVRVLETYAGHNSNPPSAIGFLQWHSGIDAPHLPQLRANGPIDQSLSKKQGTVTLLSTPPERHKNAIYFA